MLAGFSKQNEFAPLRYGRLGIILVHRRYQLTFCRRTYLDDAPAGATQIGIPAETDTGSMPKGTKPQHLRAALHPATLSAKGESAQGGATVCCLDAIVDVMQPEYSPQ